MLGLMVHILKGAMLRVPDAEFLAMLQVGIATSSALQYLKIR